MVEIVWNVIQKFLQSGRNETDFAFLVLNQPISCAPDLIKSLWDTAIIRATVDGGTNRWLDFIEKHQGLRLKLPDFISGDFDSITARAKSYFENKRVNFIPTPDQDETDFTKALKCIAKLMNEKKLNVKYVLALCESCGRFDQIIANINTLHRSNNFLPDIPVILLSSENITWLLRPGKHIIHVTDEFVQKQFCCGLIPFCGPTVITTSGLKWNLDKDTSVMSKLVSTSNTFSAKEIHVTCDQDLIWTTQYSSRTA